MYRNVALALALIVFSNLVTALRAVPGQQCAAACGNVTSTTSEEIVCSDSEFSTTAAGQAFQNCIACEINSTAVDSSSGESDLQWALYNMRFAMSSCLFSYPNATAMTQDTPCITELACGLFESSIEFDYLSPNVSEYAYCSGFVTASENACTNCLTSMGTDYIMSNFFTSLIAGCEQMPAPGSLLSMSGTVFSTTPVTIISPSSAAAAAAKASAKSMSTSTKVGIAIGCIVGFLIITGFMIIWCGKRRRQAKLAKRASRQDIYTQPPSGNGRGFPVTAPPLTTKWGGMSAMGADDSPSTAGGYGSETHSFSPYSSQYSSPVSARDMVALKETWDWKQPSMSTIGEDGSVAGTPRAAPAMHLGPPGKLGDAVEMERLRIGRTRT